jgi:hypothetical protein
MNDLYLNNHDWTPICRVTGLCGTFDGRGHTISGLNVNNTTTEYAGLFGSLDGGTIQYLMVEGSVAGKNIIDEEYEYEYAPYVGGIVGYSDDFEKTATIKFCSFKGTLSATDDTDVAFEATCYAGGIVGSITGTISNCLGLASAITLGGSNGANGRKGGIAGRNNVGTVTNSAWLEVTAIPDLGAVGSNGLTVTDSGVLGTLPLATLNSGSTDYHWDTSGGTPVLVKGAYVAPQ